MVLFAFPMFARYVCAVHLEAKNVTRVPLAGFLRVIRTRLRSDVCNELSAVILEPTTHVSHMTLFMAINPRQFVVIG
jgi:hypothetical protein